VATWQLCPALGQFGPHHVLRLQQRSAMCAATAASKDLGECRLWAVRVGSACAAIAKTSDLTRLVWARTGPFLQTTFLSAKRSFLPFAIVGKSATFQSAAHYVKAVAYRETLFKKIPVDLRDAKACFASIRSPQSGTLGEVLNIFICYFENSN